MSIRYRRVIRFMSAQEALILAQHRTVFNTTDHHAKGNKSESIGSCFMLVDGRKQGMVYHTARYLANIVSFDVCLVATVNMANPKFVMSSGRYTDYDCLDATDDYRGVTRKELGATEYTLDDFEHWAFYSPDNSLFEGDHPFTPLLLGRYAGVWENPIYQGCKCGWRGCKLKRAI